MPAGAIPFPFGECRICADKATGVHYGVETCEGCKVGIDATHSVVYQSAIFSLIIYSTYIYIYIYIKISDVLEL